MSEIVSTPAEAPTETLTLPARGYAIDRRRALLAAGACWAGFAVMALLVARGMTGGFDAWGLLAARGGPDLALIGPPIVAESVRDVTALGGVLLRNLIALGAVAALLFLSLRREALLFAATVAGGWIANTAAKHLVLRERPQIVPHLMEAGGPSFPSGHAFNGAVVWVGMALAFAALSRRHSVRVTLIVGGMVVAAAIAWSRVVLGVHYPSDVVAGWLGGCGWAFLAAALFYPAVREGDESGSHPTPGSATLNRSRANGL